MTAYYTPAEVNWLHERLDREQNATVPKSVDDRGNIIWGTDFKQRSDTSPSEMDSGGDCA